MDRPTHFDTHGVFVGASHGNVVQVQEYLTRFESIPDTLELDHVSLKGTVIITANHGDRIDIPAGSMLENDIVSGNFGILDH